MKKVELIKELGDIIDYLKSAKSKAESAVNEYPTEDMIIHKYKHALEAGALEAYIEHAVLKLEILLKTI